MTAGDVPDSQRADASSLSHRIFLGLGFCSANSTATASRSTVSAIPAGFLDEVTELEARTHRLEATLRGLIHGGQPGVSHVSPSVLSAVARTPGSDAGGALGEGCLRTGGATAAAAPMEVDDGMLEVTHPLTWRSQPAAEGESRASRGSSHERRTTSHRRHVPLLRLPSLHHTLHHSHHRHSDQRRHSDHHPTQNAEGGTEPPAAALETAQARPSLPHSSADRPSLTALARRTFTGHGLCSHRIVGEETRAASCAPLAEVASGAAEGASSAGGSGQNGVEREPSIILSPGRGPAQKAPARNEAAAAAQPRVRRSDGHLHAWHGPAMWRTHRASSHRGCCPVLIASRAATPRVAPDQLCCCLAPCPPLRCNAGGCWARADRVRAGLSLCCHVPIRRRGDGARYLGSPLSGSAWVRGTRRRPMPMRRIAV